MLESLSGVSGEGDSGMKREPLEPGAERVRGWETGASPFGLAFRLSEVRDGAIPVETWGYEAAFLPAGTRIPIVTPPYVWHESLIFLWCRKRPQHCHPSTDRRSSIGADAVC